MSISMALTSNFTVFCDITMCFGRKTSLGFGTIWFDLKNFRYFSDVCVYFATYLYQSSITFLNSTYRGTIYSQQSYIVFQILLKHNKLIEYGN